MSYEICTLEEYEAEHLESEVMNRGSQKEMDEANAMFKDAYDNIIYLLHDYYDLIILINNRT